MFCKTKSQCASTHHSRAYVHVDIHIICRHTNGLPELHFELRHSGEVSQTDRQRTADWRSDQTGRAMTKRFQTAMWKFQTLDRLTIRVKPDTCRAKLKGKREVYRRSDGTQKLLTCTGSVMLQAASAVHLTVVLCDLAYISSEQAVLHCSEALQATYLFRRQTGQHRVAVI